MSAIARFDCIKKDVLKNFAIFTGLQACNFIIKRLQHGCFPVKFAKFLRTAIWKNFCEQLLLTKDFLSTAKKVGPKPCFHIILQCLKKDMTSFSKMEPFVIIVNGLQRLTIFAKNSILEETFITFFKTCQKNLTGICNHRRYIRSDDKEVKKTKNG